MKSCLRVCDFFGQRFHLYIGYKPKFYTYFGGILSLISFISYILIFILLGYDDLKRKIPNSNISTSPPLGYRNIKFGEEKIYLPWRIIDYDENPINITGIIYPKIFYFSIEPDNVTGELVTKYNLIDYKLCNETSMKNLGGEYIIDIPLDKLYCIDMESLKVGGSWNTNFLNFIRFDLYMCKDGIDYNESNFKCTTYENLENIYGGGESIFFELLYPIVQFQPTNLEVPVLIVYKSHYYIINKFSNKLDRIYLKEYILYDEKSWIVNHPNNVTFWGVSKIDGESYIKGDRDVLRFASTSKCYTLNIYFEFGNVFYTRKYKKIYEILGEIFPIINVFYYIFELIARQLNEAYAAKKLNEYIMGYETNKERKNFVSFKDQNPIQKQKSDKLEDLNQKNSITKQVFIFKNKNHYTNERNSNKLIDNSFEDISKIMCKPNNSNVNNNLNKKPLTKNILDDNNAKRIIESIEQNKKKTKDKFPLKYYFYGMLYMNLNYTYKNRNTFFGVSSNFVKSYTYYRNMIDITSFIKVYKDCEAFKKLTLKNEGQKNEKNLENIKGSVRTSQIFKNYLY